MNPLPIADKNPRRKYFRRLLLWATLTGLGASCLHAGTALSLGLASGYNVFVLGAYSTSGSTDIQGSVAVGGTFTSNGFLSINEMPGSATPSTVGLVVGSNLSLAGGQLDNTNSGDAWVGGSVSSSANFNFEQHLNYVTSFNPANIETGYTPAQISSSLMPINFSSAATTLTQLSDTLGTLAVNGTVTTSGSNLTFTATGCTVCVFDLPAADMPGGAISNSAISINAPTGATVIVNVPGTADSISNSSITYTGGATASDTIFNFDAAKSLTTSGATVNGSILAPFATFTGTNGSVDGELIAGSVTNESAELESAYIFSGNLGSVATPEPSTWILMAGALFVCALLRTKRTTSAAN